MRIAYDYQIFGAQEYGGVSRYFVELAGNIANTPDTTVAMVSPLYVNSYLASRSNRLRVMGRHVPALPYSGHVRRRINGLLSPLMMARFRPELVHETYYSVKRVAPKWSKTVTTVHDMTYELFPEYLPPRATVSRDKWLAVDRADHVICVSEQTREDLVTLFGIDPSRVSVVYHGFSLTRPPMEVEQVAGHPFLLYVGHREGYKNFEVLLRAYAASPQLQREFDLMAFGGGTFTRREMELVQQYGIRPECVRQAAGDDAVLAGLYRKAALLVYPSRYEGFGLPPLEAMSFDCPVVCSNVSSIPEVVGDAAQLFDPDSSVDLGLAIDRVLNDTGMRRSLITRGRERVKLFSWERCASETLEVYRRLLS